VVQADIQQRIAIGRSARDLSGADHAASAWPVLDNDGLPEPRGQSGSDQSRHGVDR